MMKKNLFLLLLALIYSLSIFSQASWNAKAGVNMSKWSDGDLGWKLGPRVGVGMEYAFDKVWALQPSLWISSKGIGSYIFSSGSVNEIYLELPVMAAARLKISNKNNIVLSAGPYFAYGIGGENSYTNNFTGKSITSSTFGSDGLKRFDAGLGTGVALEIDHFIISLDGEWGLTKLNSDEGNPKNDNYALSIGFWF